MNIIQTCEAGKLFHLKSVIMPRAEQLSGVSKAQTSSLLCTIPSARLGGQSPLYYFTNKQAMQPIFNFPALKIMVSNNWFAKIILIHCRMHVEVFSSHMTSEKASADVDSKIFAQLIQNSNQKLGRITS